MSRYPQEKTIRILELLNESSLGIADILDFLSSGGFAYKMRKTKEAYKAFRKRSAERRRDMRNTDENEKNKQQLYNLINKLQSHGLVAKEKKGQRSLFSLTQKGIKKYRAWKALLQKTMKSAMPPNMPTRYEKIKTSSSIIISFDIPEQEKHKRRWLRSVLKNLDFRILHHSTWIGAHAIPPACIKDMERMNVLRHVKIFSVVERGMIDA